MLKSFVSSTTPRCALTLACQRNRRSVDRRSACRVPICTRINLELLNGRKPQHRMQCNVSRKILHDPAEGRTERTTAAGGLPETREHPSAEARPPSSPPKKLLRFATPATRDYRQALLNFRHQEEVKDGTVVVRPLILEDLTEATDLLTQVFAATDDKFGLYTRYMRGQIRQYLENHIRIAPDAVVLVATLHPRPSGSSSSSNGSSRSSSSNDSSSTVHSKSSDGAQASSSEAQLSPFERDSSGPPLPHQSQHAADASGEGGGSAEPGSAAKERLLGTVEVAFTQSTRTTFLTLNPPKDCAYLGNMCVDEPFRRRGYGKVLLRAGEQLTRLASFPAIFLHLRFKDVGAAALYEGEGYTEVKRDLWLLSFLGYSRRFLMKKTLSK